MLSVHHGVSIALVLLTASGCKKQEQKAPAGGGSASASATPAGGGSASAAPAAGDAVALGDLKVEVAGKPLAPLYGVAQPDPAHGNSHQLTFTTQPITCATRTKLLEAAAEASWLSIRVHEALKPDGTLTWAYGGASFGRSGSTPANMVAMGSYAVDGGKVTGTLPASVAHEDETHGTLTATGGFTVPVCEPLPLPRLRDLADNKKDATPIALEGATARVTVAGKTFDVKGATALRGQDGDLEVRLSDEPHGCSFEVPGNLHVGLRVGKGETKLSLGGNWIAGTANVEPLGGDLKVTATPGTNTVALTFAGAMDYVPGEGTYKVAMEGAVTATVCEVK